MEGTLLLNYVLLIGLFAGAGFFLGVFARRLTSEARRREDEAELQMLRRALAGNDEVQV